MQTLEDMWVELRSLTITNEMVVAASLRLQPCVESFLKQTGFGNLERLELARRFLLCDREMPALDVEDLIEDLMAAAPHSDDYTSQSPGCLTYVVQQAIFVLTSGIRAKLGEKVWPNHSSMGQYLEAIEPAAKSGVYEDEVAEELIWAESLFSGKILPGKSSLFSKVGGNAGAEYYYNADKEREREVVERSRQDPSELWRFVEKTMNRIGC